MEGEEQEKGKGDSKVSEENGGRQKEGEGQPSGKRR